MVLAAQSEKIVAVVSISAEPAVSLCLNLCNIPKGRPSIPGVRVVDDWSNLQLLIAGRTP
jgi:hypothetical protein